MSDADTPVAIVRDLAASLPPMVATSTVGMYWCAVCQRDTMGRPGRSKSFDEMSDPVSHRPECLWRRARALYPG